MYRMLRRFNKDFRNQIEWLVTGTENDKSLRSTIQKSLVVSSPESTQGVRYSSINPSNLTVSHYNRLRHKQIENNLKIQSLDIDRRERLLTIKESLEYDEQLDPNIELPEQTGIAPINRWGPLTGRGGLD